MSTHPDPVPIDRSAIYSRFEDMSPDGRLMVMMGNDGDIIVTCTAMDPIAGYLNQTTVEFCAIGSGGAGGADESDTGG